MRRFGLVAIACATACSSLLGLGDDEPTPSTEDGGTSTSGGQPSSSGSSSGDEESSSSSSSSGRTSSSSSSSSSSSGTADSGPVTPDARWAEQVVLGETFACARTRAGSVWCWGENAVGQLGTGTTESATRPVQVPGLVGVVEIAAGGFHACARLEGGTVQCWGRADRGQVGHGTAPASVLSPAAVSQLAGVTGLALGFSHSCARLEGGTVQCWGDNTYGEIGQDMVAIPGGVAYPMAVAGATGVVALGSGSTASHTCASRSDGSTVCWGINTELQLGHTGGTTSTPTLVPDLEDVTNVCAAVNTTSVVLQDGRVVAWGSADNDWAESGLPEFASWQPSFVPGVSGVVQVACGSRHGCTRGANGVVCYGNDYHGQLGRNDPPLGLVAKAANSTSVLNDAVDLAVGGLHTCATTTNGSLYCWGYNDDGLLGVELPDAKVTHPAPVIAFGPEL